MAKKEKKKSKGEDDAEDKEDGGEAGGKDDPKKNAAEGEDGAENAEGGEEGEGGGFGLRKIVLFVVLPLVLLGAIGGGLYFTGMIDKFLGKETEAGGEEHAQSESGDGHGGKKKDKKDGGHGEHGEGGATDAFFLQIPNMLVNLSGAEGQSRYLKLAVQLELASQEDLVAVEAVMPRVVDQFQTYLRELRVKDLRGSAGIYRLQMELLARVNAAAYPVEVKDVLFQEILIQ